MLTILPHRAPRLATPITSSAAETDGRANIRIAARVQRLRSLLVPPSRGRDQKF